MSHTEYVFRQGLSYRPHKVIPIYSFFCGAVEDLAFEASLVELVPLGSRSAVAFCSASTSAAAFIFKREREKKRVFSCAGATRQVSRRQFISYQINDDVVF